VEIVNASFTRPAAIKSLWALIAVAIVGLLPWLRVRRVSGRLRELEVARLAERDRIARDLHDTLLQSTEGLILKVYIAAQQLAPDDPVRAFLMRSLDQAEELAIEGRQKLLGLRNPLSQRLELSQALAALGLGLSANTTTTFSAVKEGRVRSLAAPAWDEIFGIAREGIVNAFKHSRAQHIEAVVTYRSSSFTIQVRDDGCGVPRHQAADGSADGRLGLRGMRERAEQLRARLEIETAEDKGTTITLIVPSHEVYRKRRIAAPEGSA
jgi:signal transduction histidine kinase